MEQEQEHEELDEEHRALFVSIMSLAKSAAQRSRKFAIKFFAMGGPSAGTWAEVRDAVEEVAAVTTAFTFAAVMRSFGQEVDAKVDALAVRIAKLEAARVRCGVYHPGGAGSCILDRGHLDLHTEGRARW